MEALKGVRILDMTHVQAGPTCSQLLAWMGADVIKFENPQGDATRGQLRDIPNADSLYFTMLNCNKRSITVNMKSAEGKQVFVDLLKKCDIVMENFGPGVLDRFGFSWEKIHEINPKIVMGSIKGFGSSGPYADFKAYENVAQGMGGVPRAGNDSGGGQLGNAIHCKPHGANDWLYIVVQEAVWGALAQRIGPDLGIPDLATDARFATIGERRKNQQLMWTLINKFAEKHTKRELMTILNPLDVPCGPIMSTQDLATDEHVHGRDMWVALDHPQRGKWYNVGMPIKLSDSPARIERSPLLGEHTDEVLKEVLGYDETKIAGLRRPGGFSGPPQNGAEP